MTIRVSAVLAAVFEGSNAITLDGSRQSGTGIICGCHRVVPCLIMHLLFPFRPVMVRNAHVQIPYSSIDSWFGTEYSTQP